VFYESVFDNIFGHTKRLLVSRSVPENRSILDESPVFIVADFDGGTSTSDAGALLLQRVDQQPGSIDVINDGITDTRDP